ncbi:MAG: hypothetical protein K2J95_11165 [Lachnospiraceae bacterium]|nr:hypothetical protein [Lachnospiraceae bacterium]
MVSNIMDAPIITYVPPKEELMIDEKEVYRYLGYNSEWIAGLGTDTKNDYTYDPADGSSEVITGYIREAIASTEAAMFPKACYGRFPIEVKGDGRILLPYGEVVSHDLTRNLYDCKEIFLFAATIGAEYDRLLRRIRLTSMAKAAILQAVGAAAVESLCNKLNGDLRKDAEAGGYKAHPRYSPGYGDYALENQKGIFAILQPSRYIGLSLMDTLIMAPEKSVTAVIGLEKR